MKKISIISLITLVFISNLIGQAPNLMSYQAVIWDASGNLVAEKMVSIKISILQGSVSGSSVYSENHRVQTNVNGLVSLMIGGGTNATGKISDINWGGGSYFLKTETDPTGGVNFSITGTTQLVSVPYSMFSGLAGNISTKNTGLPGQTLTIDKDGKMTWVGTNVPTVMTVNITSITQTDSKASGIVSSDGGSSITARGFVWSTNPNPIISLSTKTSDGTGVGTYSSNITGLIPNTKYFIRAYATNSAGTGYGDPVEFATISPTGIGFPCPGVPTVKDIDGNTYNTVQIGNQCWLKENLRVTKFNDGTEIKLDTTGGVTGGVGNTWATWGNPEKGKRTVYGNDFANLEKFGYLYNWIAAIKGICPSGWVVPTLGDVIILKNSLGSFVGGKMKSISGWEAPNYGATNESGFSALPGGLRDQNGPFGSINTAAYFWTSEESSSPTYIHFISLNNTSREMDPTAGLIRVPFGLSIRCVKK